MFPRCHQNAWSYVTAEIQPKRPMIANCFLIIFLQMKASSDGEDDDEDDDDDFDEVPEKEGYEPNIPEHLRAEYGKFIFIKKDVAIVDAFIDSVS